MNSINYLKLIIKEMPMGLMVECPGMIPEKKGDLENAVGNETLMAVKPAGIAAAA